MTLKFKPHTVSIAFISLVVFTLLTINPGCKKHDIKWDLERINPVDSTNITINPSGSPSVNTVSISNINQNSAIVNGEIISLGNSAVTEHGHCWATSTYPTISDSKTTLGSMSNLGTYSSSLNGLNNNSTYFVRAYATNSSGTAYGNQISFTAGQNTYAPIVTTGPVNNITAISATAPGTITDLGGSTITQHGHCWSTSASPTISDSKTTLGSITNTVNFNSNLTSLEPNTTYYIRAFATNGSATSYSNQISFTTLGLWSSIGQLSGITFNNNAMLVLSFNNVWLVGDNVWNWDGNNWNTIGSPNNLNLKAIHGTSSNNIWVIDANNGIWKWNGATWTQFQTCGFLGDFNDLLAFGNSIVIGGTINSGPGLCISTNNGTSWTQENSTCSGGNCNGFVDMDGTSMNNIWVGAGSSVNNGVQGTVLFNGVSWSSNEYMYNIQCLSTLSSSIAFATSAPNSGFWHPTIYKYNGGWTQITNPTGMDMNSSYTPIDAVSSNEIWFGSDKIYNYDGVSWTEETGSISNNIKIIQMLNNNEGFAVTGNGTILRRE